MIEESEKKGTAMIKSHAGLIKKKVINLNINSYIHRVDDFKLKLYANTTFWELKEIISKRVSISFDFLIVKINHEIVNENFNGKTLYEINVIIRNYFTCFFLYYSIAPLPFLLTRIIKNVLNFKL